MKPRRSGSTLALTLIILGSSSAMGAPQGFSVGSLDTPSVALSGPSGIYTVINDSHPATRDGEVSAVTLFWSASPCPRAVKIKQFRHISAVGFGFIDERGPFDVSGHTNTYFLGSPLHFSAGDLLGVTVLTSCGSPLVNTSEPTGGPTYILAGDVATDVFPLTSPPGQVQSLDLVGYDRTFVLSLLNNRFALTLTLTDARSGRTTNGVPLRLTDRAGYFSAPAFTGDDALPEVVVKATDATSALPPFGGSFWIFHGSLTDTTYILSVTDTSTGITKQYVGAQPFCGGADTSAFGP